LKLEYGRKAGGKMKRITLFDYAQGKRRPRECRGDTEEKQT
jgi:hypothetical protein